MCPVSPTDSLQKRGESLYQVTTQIGCGIKRFEKTGRAQLESLVRHGRSHESDEPGICRHSFKWIQGACAARELDVELLKGEKIHKQKWILIHR